MWRDGPGSTALGIAAYSTRACHPTSKSAHFTTPTPTPPAAGANAMTQSLARGERVTLTKVDAFADGVAVK